MSSSPSTSQPVIGVELKEVVLQLSDSQSQEYEKLRAARREQLRDAKARVQQMRMERKERLLQRNRAVKLGPLTPYTDEEIEEARCQPKRLSFKTKVKVWLMLKKVEQEIEICEDNIIVHKRIMKKARTEAVAQEKRLKKEEKKRRFEELVLALGRTPPSPPKMSKSLSRKSTTRVPPAAQMYRAFSQQRTRGGCSGASSDDGFWASVFMSG